MKRGIGKIVYSPRKDNDDYSIILELGSEFDFYRPKGYNPPLYGYHIMLVNGNQEAVTRIGHKERAALEFSFSEEVFFSKDGRRAMLQVNDIFGELGDFRERLGWSQNKGGIGWHISVGYLAKSP
jgi:hypothetical protein